MSSSVSRTPPALYALAIGAFGIGTTEFMPMGLLQQIAGDLRIDVATAGLLISAYALGVFAGAPVLTLATRRLPRKGVLLGLMVIFTLGNLASALAPSYATLLVAANRQASAISTMFNGLAVATLLGVPAGAWLGLHFGWHAAFWAVAVVGSLAMLAVAVLVPATRNESTPAALGTELRAIASTPVLLGLTTTVFGFAGVFVVYTYIEPLLTRVTGFADSAVSPILLVFGVGMLIGNPLGGRLADRALAPALLGSLAALAAVLLGLGLLLGQPWPMVLFIGLLGLA